MLEPWLLRPTALALKPFSPEAGSAVVIEQRIWRFCPIAP